VKERSDRAQTKDPRDCACETNVFREFSPGNSDFDSAKTEKQHSWGEFPETTRTIRSVVGSSDSAVLFASEESDFAQEDRAK